MTMQTEHPVTVDVQTESTDQHWVVCTRCGTRWVGPLPTRTGARTTADAMNRWHTHRPPGGLLRSGVCCEGAVIVPQGPPPPEDTGLLPAPLALALGVVRAPSLRLAASAALAFVVVTGAAMLLSGGPADQAITLLAPLVVCGGVVALVMLGTVLVQQSRQQADHHADRLVGHLLTPAPRHRDSGEHVTALTEMPDLVDRDPS